MSRQIRVWGVAAGQVPLAVEDDLRQGENLMVNNSNDRRELEAIGEKT